MGDRANVFFVDQTDGNNLSGMYFYTHWAGEGLPFFVQKALERGKDRWGDTPYLARILFCELVQDEVLGETGYGLSTCMGDNEHLIIRVNDAQSRVSFHNPGKESDASDAGTASWTFEQYVAASEEELHEKFLDGDGDDDGEDEDDEDDEDE